MNSSDNPSGNSSGGDAEIEDTLTGNMGGRPPDVLLGAGVLDLGDKDTAMADGADAGEQLHRMVVNRRRRNVGNLNLGVNGGTRKERDTRGSRFTVLLPENPLEVDMDNGPQQVEEENGVGVATPVVQLDALDPTSGHPKRAGDSAEQQRKRQIAQGKLVGAASGAGRSMAASDGPAGSSELGTVQVREGVSVASSETVVRASSNLNGEKDVAVRIGSEEDSRMTWNGRGRVLPASIRGLASKSSSKIQLGVKGVAKVSLKSSKSDDRGALKIGPGNHFNNQVSDLNKAASDEELRQAQSREIGDTEEARIGWKTNSVYEHPGKEPRLVVAYFGATAPRPIRVVDMVLANRGNSTNWKRIWKLEVPQRIRVFVWLLFHESGREDLEHVLRSCTTAKGVWNRAVPRAAQEVFFSLPFRDWLNDNLFSASFVLGDVAWGVRFAILCWLLWKRRCSFLFGSDEEILEHILSRGNRIVGECSRTVALNSDPRQGQDRRSSWTRPRTGWIKVNVDASVSTVDRSVGAGGALRDEHGAWLSGYARFVGRCDSLLAELWAMHDGLILAWDLGFRCVELESDCLEAVRFISSRSDVLGKSALVGAIVHLLHRNWNVEVRHIARGSNGVGDKLAKRGRELGMKSTIFVAAPAAVAGLVEVEQRDSLAPTSAQGVADDLGGSNW
ncbi:hypothetical protein V6N11_028705 [Hibiscus sabdariffa]|uniref:RNase H type-1 domain-containing protein n=1 Tax=Hibiscus sabdariffa TaxID=183260 RepID=A0ABR2PQK9_9ROSI